MQFLYFLFLIYIFNLHFFREFGKYAISRFFSTNLLIFSHDFFLVSQHVRQGTVTPTHYIVVHDTSGWGPDKLQKLSYKLTHLYYNWPGTVRVPAPIQVGYIKKICQEIKLTSVITQGRISVVA